MPEDRFNQSMKPSESPLTSRLASEYGILEPVQDFHGSRWEKGSILLIGQDPSVSTGAQVKRALMLDDPRSALSRYIAEGILTPLGWELDYIAATNLVKTRFRTSVSWIAKEEQQPLSRLVTELAKESWSEFQNTVRWYRPKAIVTLGRPVFSALNEIANLNLIWEKRFSGKQFNLPVGDADFRWVPCVHIRSFKRWRFHRENQVRNLALLRETIGPSRK